MKEEVEHVFRADLHIHSSFSDCPRGLKELFSLARRNGITHMSLTDHDTVCGCIEAQTLAKQTGIRFIKGIEISAFDFREQRSNRNRKVHILGYGFKSDALLQDFCSPVRERRHRNSLRQIEILRETLKYRITEGDVAEYAFDVIYKQHILHYLRDSGQTPSIFHDYDRLFKNKGPCDFDIVYLDARDAVRAIVEAGGVPVLAHPMQQNNLELLPSLCSEGLAGVELEHYTASGENKNEILEIASRHGLFCTGGSDYHDFYSKEPLEIGSHCAPHSAEIIF
ncbi:MAG: PHP domain-containing protein [Synergistaceae bacterium]|jgi:predicted metal-dependent phosphoesterase TrpH|nr:PHP domain-containing protein [Synergistaceae bacterium]